MSYTKGKWEITKYTEDIFVIHKGTNIICATGKTNGIFYKHPVSKANANLIAAAPQLLEACKKVEWVWIAGSTIRRCPWCDGGEGLGHNKDCIRQQAIAAAEKGE